MDGIGLVNTRVRLLATTVPLLLLALIAKHAEAVDFDFPRALACRDVTPVEVQEREVDQRVIEVALDLSVRFYGKEADEVERIDVDVESTMSNLLVHEFSPTTELASDLGEDIKHVKTTEKKRSLDATLGGALPIPAGELVAHVTPSLSGGIGQRETATVTTSRLPPKHAVVVSGTTQQARGVFFKLKRTSQTTLEGVHELKVRFLAPADWQTGALRVSCVAHGRRKLLGIVEHPTTISRFSAPIYLYMADNEDARQLALRRAERGDAPYSRHEPVLAPPEGKQQDI